MSEPPFIIKYMSDNLLLSAADDLRADGPAEPGPQEPDPVLVPLERLEERICELAAHLAAGTCRFLQLVAEFDARGGWATWDLPSCAAWLAWKCQVAPGTAREQVRVARALASLPRITAEFAAGRMSYAKVRALTRIATTATEADLAEIAGPMSRSASGSPPRSASGSPPRSASGSPPRTAKPPTPRNWPAGRNGG